MPSGIDEEADPFRLRQVDVEHPTPTGGGRVLQNMSALRGLFSCMGDDRRSTFDQFTRQQLGLITRTQALHAGVSSSTIDRRLSRGELERVAPHVYRLRAGAPESPEQKLLAACLSFGRGAVASHRSAAWLWRLDGFRDAPPPEVSVPHGCRLQVPGVTPHQRRQLAPEGYCKRAGVPVTTLHRTILDLESSLSENKLEIALDSAARGHPELFIELTEFLAPISTQWRNHGGRLDSLVALRVGGEPTGSAFETRLLQMIRKAGIEPPTLQYPVFKELDHPFVHIDFAWVKRKIALFADGASYHLARRRARLDASQRLHLTRLGWRPVVVLPRMLDDPSFISSFAPLFKP